MKGRAIALAVLLVGCGGEDPAPGDAPEPPDVSAQEPSGPAPGDGLRPPSGGADVNCDGPVDDPDQIDLFAESAARDLGGAIRGLETLAGRHPASSTARVRLGELLLRATPPRAEEADTWFDRALDLHARGCTLGDRDHWAALEGQGISRMMRGDYAGAREPLSESVRRWPGSRATHYNLACARCQTDDLEGCTRELEITLGELDVPSFLEVDTRPASYYRQRIQSDPDLEPIRRDAPRLHALLER